MTAGRSIKDLWEPAALESIKQALKQQGILHYPRYTAYTWVETPNGVRRERHNFVAKSFELIEIYGDLYRLSVDVQLA
jgi:hypothetical protein